MSPADVLALLVSAAPSVVNVTGALVRGLVSKDVAAVRAATEAALRLVFEARQDLPGARSGGSDGH